MIRSQRSAHCGSGSAQRSSTASEPGGGPSLGTVVAECGAALLVFRPDHARQVGSVQLGQLFEEVQGIEQDADGVVERVEVVDPDQTGRLAPAGVEVLMPLPVVDDLEVACRP